MVQILLRDGSLYSFHNAKQAALWLKDNPEKFDHDMENVLVLSDKKFPGLPIIELLKEQVAEMIQCRGCASHLKFFCDEDDHDFVVVCPACHGRNSVHR